MKLMTFFIWSSVSSGFGIRTGIVMDEWVVEIKFRNDSSVTSGRFAISENVGGLGGPSKIGGNS